MKKEGDKHHYIPKFYLKQWALTDGELCEFRQSHGMVKCKLTKMIRWRMTVPDGTGYVRGLYTFDHLPAPTNDIIEKQLLMKADDAASKALQRMLLGDLNFDGPTQSAWSRFLMSLLHRNPERIAHLRTQMAEEYPKYLDSIRDRFEEIRDPSDPRTYEEFRTSIGVVDEDRMNLRLLRLILDSSTVGTELNHMKWGTVQFHDLRFPLLTSDRPLLMTNGIKHPKGQIILPISPDTIFYAARSLEVAAEIQQACKMAITPININDRVVSQARRFVYGINERQLRFVSNRFGRHWPSTPMHE